MKFHILALAILMCGSAFAETGTAASSSSSVGVGAQRALDAAFGGLSVPAIGLGALLWGVAVSSAKSTTGTTGTQ
jgi:hypothetical protein